MNPFSPYADGPAGSPGRAAAGPARSGAPATTTRFGANAADRSGGATLRAPGTTRPPSTGGTAPPTGDPGRAAPGAGEAPRTGDSGRAGATAPRAGGTPAGSGRAVPGASGRTTTPPAEARSGTRTPPAGRPGTSRTAPGGRSTTPRPSTTPAGLPRTGATRSSTTAAGGARPRPGRTGTTGATRSGTATGTPRSVPARTGTTGTIRSGTPRPAPARTGTTGATRSGTPTGGTARSGAGTAARSGAGTPRPGPARTATGAPRSGTGTTGTARPGGPARSGSTGTPRSGAGATGTTGTAVAHSGRTGLRPTTARATAGTATRTPRPAPHPTRTPTGGPRTPRTARAAAAGTRVTRATRTGGGPPRRPRSRLLRLGDPGRRLGVGFAAVCTLLVILGGRLVQLQGFDGEHLAAKAQERLLYPTTIPALRGQIMDRDGRLLAYSVSARTIYADPGGVKDPAGTARKLAPALKKSAAWLAPRLAKPGTRYVPLATDVTPSDAEAILKLRLAGIGAEPTTERVYPGKDLAASVVGWTNAEGGLGGIESKYDDQLSGTPGRLEVERASDGTQIPGGLRQETAAVPGSAVQLTIDEDLQYRTQRALAAAVAKAKAEGGQAVVLDRRTGEVLAMASVPTFDAQDPSSSAPASRSNLAVQAPVEPGSANKLVTFAAALDQGKITPDTVLTVPDSIRVADRYVHDAWSHRPQKFTATGVLAKSSNVGTLMVANELLGPRTFYEYEKRFGIGTRTGIELPGESPGVLPAPETWSGTTFGNLPIGQGLSMTPLQLASMYQAVANDGVRVEPRIVKAVVGPDGSATPTAAPARTTVVSPQAARTVRTMLEAVVGKGGTAPGAAIADYRVAGKTGTAQKPDPECRCYSGGGYWATFAGIAPADDPELVMAVVIDEAKGGAHGGTVAGPLFKEVMSYALTARKVTPTGTPAPTPTLIVD